jgi:hypothetical protein
MNYDSYGQVYATEDDLCAMLYNTPELKLENILVEDPRQFNQAQAALYADVPRLKKYIPLTATLEEFDQTQQADWHMPVEYLDLDIAQWVLEQCNTEVELQRCGEELLLFMERDLFPLLRYLKYLVDTMRNNNVVWGVGRGSSVASFVLYKMGVHRINSLYYDLDPAEFLK